MFKKSAVAKLNISELKSKGNSIYSTSILVSVPNLFKYVQ